MSDWLKFLPMEKFEQPTIRTDHIGGTKLSGTLNINGSFEFEASKLFNELPVIMS